jgi:hypothetical protein
MCESQADTLKLLAIANELGQAPQGQGRPGQPLHQPRTITIRQ